MTLFYAIGITVPLLVLAVVAQRATERGRRMRSRLPDRSGKVAGVVLGVATLGHRLQLARSRSSATCPATPQRSRTTSSRPTRPAPQLRQLSGEHQNQFAAANARLEGKKATCSATDAGQSQSGHLAAGKTDDHHDDDGTGSADHGTAEADRRSWPTRRTCPTWASAPNFTGITAWFNTPGNQPLSLSQLRGKVVLVDFWTYSCINCQRALPHVEGWYNDYK